jgi:ABC-type Fe3+-siderophore transport system permease subunit
MKSTNKTRNSLMGLPIAAVAIISAGLEWIFKSRLGTALQKTLKRKSETTSGETEADCNQSRPRMHLLSVTANGSWRISYQELKRRKDPDESVLDEIIGSKDPTVFTVFLEDSAALIGAALAFVGIWLGRVLHNPFLDPSRFNSRWNSASGGRGFVRSGNGRTPCR